MSVQPHPEFTWLWSYLLREAGQSSAPEALVATAKASLEQPSTAPTSAARSRGSWQGAHSVSRFDCRRVGFRQRVAA